MSYQFNSDGTMLIRDSRVYIPVNEQNSDYREYLRWSEAGNVVAPAPALTADQLTAQYTVALQARMDLGAQERGYDGIQSGISYLQSSIPRLAAEATAMHDWRDAVWEYGVTELDAVQEGRKPLPLFEDFIAAMPQIQWPEVAPG